MGLFLSDSISSLTFVVILSRSYNPVSLYTCVLQLRRSVPLVVDDFFVLRTFGRERDPQQKIYFEKKGIYC
jgi:hypothetical protein